MLIKLKNFENNIFIATTVKFKLMPNIICKNINHIKYKLHILEKENKKIISSNNFQYNFYCVIYYVINSILIK